MDRWWGEGVEKEEEEDEKDDGDPDSQEVENRAHEPRLAALEEMGEREKVGVDMAKLIAFFN